MKRYLITILLAAIALALHSTGRLDAQEPEADEAQEESRWLSVKNKGLSLLKPAQEKVQAHIEELLEDLNERYLPAIKEAGFGVSEIRVTIGMPTALVLHLTRFEVIDPAEQKRLLEQHRDDALVEGILEALFASNKIEVEGYQANEVHISLGFPPSATLVLTPNSTLQDREAPD